MFLDNIEINIPNQKDTYKSKKNTADKEKMQNAECRENALREGRGGGGLSAHHGTDHGPNSCKDTKP
jgi:hypothetical protein